MTEGADPGRPRRRPGRRAAERAARLRREGARDEAAAIAAGGVRLNKLLASRGLGARRKCDALIQAGSVRVNGTVVKEPGTQVIPERDRIEVHGRPIPGRAALRYVMIHKPVGVITTLDDPEGRPTVRALLPPGPRLFPVGRLDIETSGLLIATNDGALAHHLMHPRYGVRKVYRARLDRPPDADQVRRLRTGVEFEPGRRSAPCEVRVRNAREERAEIEIALHEGRYRQVRRMCEAVGLYVARLHRPGYGPLELGSLPRGAWRDLSADEVRRLRAASARPVERVRAPRRAAAGTGSAPGSVPGRSAPSGARGRAGRPRVLRGRPSSRASSAVPGSRSPATPRARAPLGAAPLSGRQTTRRPLRGDAPAGRRTARRSGQGAGRTSGQSRASGPGRGAGPAAGRRSAPRPGQGRPGQRTGPGGPARPGGKRGRVRTGPGGRPGGRRKGGPSAGGRKSTY